MKITCDPIKRQKTLDERGLDFLDAWKVFEGPHFTQIDDRCDYGEVRKITVGSLDSSFVAVVWTKRDEETHVISMRKINDREKRKYKKHLG